MGQEPSKQEQTIVYHTGIQLQDKSKIRYMYNESFFPMVDDKVMEAAGMYIGTFKNGLPCVVPVEQANLLKL